MLVALTEPGRRLIAERRARLQPRWDAALADFSDEQLVTAAAVLDRLRQLFDLLCRRAARRLRSVRYAP